MDQIDVDKLYRAVSGKSATELSGDKLELATDTVANRLTSMVMTNKIPFPYRRLFMGDIDEYFEILKTVKPIISHERFKLRSYYPMTSGAFFPPLFRGRPTLITSITDNLKIDQIADWYIQEIRYNTRRNDQPFSILEAWKKPEYVKRIMLNAIKEPIITTESLAHAITDTIIDVRLFKPSWAIFILKAVLGNNLKDKVWIDISAGWGDRLIAAMAQDMKYTGYDPNLELQPGHSAMISRFGNGKQKVIYQPFEEAQLTPNSADVVFSSPPFFDLEIYAADQKGQSVDTYPQFEVWTVRFLFRALSNAWEALKIGGYLVIHLGDTQEIRTCEAMNIFIQNNLRGSSWEGIIGLQGGYGVPRPVWVWKKVSTDRKIWSDRNGPNNLVLFTHYPKIQLELIRYYGEKYSNEYKLRLENMRAIAEIYKTEIAAEDKLLINTIYEHVGQDFLETWIDNRDNSLIPEQCIEVYNILCDNFEVVHNHVKTQLPNIDPEVIEYLLQDPILVQSILEKFGTDRGLGWFVAMIKLAFP